MAGYMTVSEVGRTAMGSASSEVPLLVTQATWGGVYTVKPLTSISHQVISTVAIAMYMYEP